MQQDLEELIRQHSQAIKYPAKKVFLEPGDKVDGVYYVAEGRIRHYRVALDGTEKIPYTLAAGWFYGEAPCSLSEPTGLFSCTEIKTTLYLIPLREYEKLMDENKLFCDAILHSYSRKMLILRHEVDFRKSFCVICQELLFCCESYKKDGQNVTENT